MIIYCVVIFLLVAYYVLTFNKYSSEFKNLPKKDFPLSFMYGGATYLITLLDKLFHKTKPSKKDLVQMKKLSNLYVGVKPERLLILYKAKCISISSALLLLICVLCLFIELMNSPSKNITSLEVPSAGESKQVYELIADIDDETTVISVSVDSKPISLEEALEYFDSKRAAIEEKLLGENSCVEDVSTDLCFFSSFDDIAISFEAENPLIINTSGKLIRENISDEGVFTSVYATLSYKGQSAMISFPLFIKPDNRTSLIDEINEYISLEMENCSDSYITLPDKINGKNIQFYTTTNSNSFYFF